MPSPIVRHKSRDLTLRVRFKAIKGLSLLIILHESRGLIVRARVEVVKGLSPLVVRSELRDSIFFFFCMRARKSRDYHHSLFVASQGN